MSSTKFCHATQIVLRYKAIWVTFTVGIVSTSVQISVLLIRQIEQQQKIAIVRHLLDDNPYSMTTIFFFSIISIYHSYRIISYMLNSLNNE